MPFNGVIERQRVTQAAAAEKLGINQPKVFALANYKLDGILGRAVDDVLDRAGPGCGDRDQEEAKVADGGKNFGDCGVDGPMNWALTLVRHARWAGHWGSPSAYQCY
jgi:hypothetical protein